MSNQPLYDIIFFGLEENANRQIAIKALSHLINVTPEKAEQLLNSSGTVIKQNVSIEQATDITSHLQKLKIRSNYISKHKEPELKLVEYPVDYEKRGSRGHRQNPDKFELYADEKLRLEAEEEKRLASLAKQEVVTFRDEKLNLRLHARLAQQKEEEERLKRYLESQIRLGLGLPNFINNKLRLIVTIGSIFCLGLILGTLPYYLNTSITPQLTNLANIKSIENNNMALPVNPDNSFSGGNLGTASSQTSITDGIEQHNSAGGSYGGNLVTASNQTSIPDRIEQDKSAGSSSGGNLVTASNQTSIPDGIEQDKSAGGSSGGNIVTASNQTSIPDGIEQDKSAGGSSGGNIVTASNQTSIPDGIEQDKSAGGSSGGNIVTASNQTSLSDKIKQQLTTGQSLLTGKAAEVAIDKCSQIVATAKTDSYYDPAIAAHLKANNDTKAKDVQKLAAATADIDEKLSLQSAATEIKTDLEWQWFIERKLQYLIQQNSIEMAFNLLNQLSTAPVKIEATAKLAQYLAEHGKNKEADNLFNQAINLAQSFSQNEADQVLMLTTIASYPAAPKLAFDTANTLIAHALTQANRAIAEAAMGVLLAQQSKAEQAHFHFMSSNAALNQAKGLTELTTGIVGVAKSYAKTKNRGSVISLLEDAVRNLDSIHDEETRNTILSEVAQVYASLGDTWAALHTLDKVHNNFARDKLLYSLIAKEIELNQLGHIMETAVAIQSAFYRAKAYGFISLAQRNYPLQSRQANMTFSDALASAQELTQPSMRSLSLMELARFAIHGSDNKQGLDLFNNAAKLFADIKNSLDYDYGLGLLAVNQARTFRLGEAETNASKITSPEIANLINHDLAEIKATVTAMPH